MERSLCALAGVVLVGFTLSQLLVSTNRPLSVEPTQAVLETSSDNETGSGGHWSATERGGLPTSALAVHCTLSLHTFRSLPTQSEFQSLSLSLSALFSAVSFLSLLFSARLCSRSPAHSRPSDDSLSLADKLRRLTLGSAPQPRGQSWLRRAEELQLISPHGPPGSAESAQQLVRPSRLQLGTGLISATASLSLSDQPAQTALFHHLSL